MQQPGEVHREDALQRLPARGEARRLAQGGGLRVNDTAETDANRTITSADLVDGVVKLAAGKKKIVLVKPV